MKLTKLLNASLMLLCVCVSVIYMCILHMCVVHMHAVRMCGGQIIYFDLLYFILRQSFSCEPRDQWFSYSGYPSCSGCPPVSTFQIQGYRQASTPTCHLWECYKPDPQYSCLNDRHFIHWTISLVSSKWRSKDRCYYTENLKTLKIK